MKKIIILFNVIIFFLSCQDSKLKEKEGNNTFQTANPIATNSVTEADLSSENDKDFYILDLRKSKLDRQVLEIQLSKVKGLDLKIAFYKGRKLVKTIDDFKINKGEKIKNLLIEKGIYYIVIEPGDNNQTYLKQHWKINKEKLFPSEKYTLTTKTKNYIYQESEPNDIYINAIELKLDQEITGSFAPFSQAKKSDNLKSPPFEDKDLEKLSQYDFDWYTFTIPVKGNHNVSLILDPVKNVDSIMGVYHEKRMVLRNSKGMGSGERISNLKVQGNKQYYVLVTGVPHDFDANSQSDYTYRLALSVDYNKSLISESESNDSIEKANEIEENKISGYISPKDDKDYYVINLNPNDSIISSFSENDYKEESQWENETEDYNFDEEKSSRGKCLEVNLSGVQSVDTMIKIFDPKGQLIKTYNSNPEGEGENVHAINLKNYDKIYISVSNSIRNKHENFKTAYTLSTQLKDIDPKFELEPNDARANLISPGDKIKGYISAFNRSDKPIIRKEQVETPDTELPYPIAVDKNTTDTELPYPIAVDKNTTDIHVNRKYSYGDIDYFKINLEPDKKYSLKFNGIDGLNLDLKLIDHNGVTVKEAKITNSKEFKYNFKTLSLLEADYLEILNFSIEIKSHEEEKSNSKTPYTLSVVNMSSN